VTGGPALDPREAGDATLVERTLGGDYVAFEVLVERYTKLAGGVAFSVTGDYHGAADVVQEVFVRALSEKARTSYDGLRPYRPYLLRIAKNLMIDRARRIGRRPSQVTSSPGEVDIDDLIDRNAPMPEPEALRLTATILPAAMRRDSSGKKPQCMKPLKPCITITCGKDAPLSR